MPEADKLQFLTEILLLLVTLLSNPWETQMQVDDAKVFNVSWKLKSELDRQL
jgi:hypothetical protein